MELIDRQEQIRKAQRKFFLTLFLMEISLRYTAIVVERAIYNRSVTGRAKQMAKVILTDIAVQRREIRDKLSKDFEPKFVNAHYKQCEIASEHINKLYFSVKNYLDKYNEDVSDDKAQLATSLLLVHIASQTMSDTNDYCEKTGLNAKTEIMRVDLIQRKLDKLLSFIDCRIIGTDKDIELATLILVRKLISVDTMKEMLGEYYTDAV